MDLPHITLEGLGVWLSVARMCCKPRFKISADFFLQDSGGWKLLIRLFPQGNEEENSLRRAHQAEGCGQQMSPPHFAGPIGLLLQFPVQLWKPLSHSGLI